LVVETPAESIPEAARRAAAVQVFDTIGVTVAAAAEPAGRIVTELVESIGGTRQAAILGTHVRTSMVQAAWANGTFAHLLDFDDVGFSHPTATILPAALAVAEHRDVSGAELLGAMVLGYEVFERLAAAGRPDDPRLRRRGYHPTPIYGAIAATAAAGRLLGLTVEQLVIAFGLAATDASGLTQQFGTWGKGVHAGNAARTGVFFADLAGRGYWGDERGLSGPRGLFAALHGEGRYDLSGIDDALGERWSILEPGLALKAYPACGSTRRAADAVLQIAGEPGFDPATVERIVVDVHPHVFNQLQFRAPTKGFRGKFSLDYTIASAALDRELTIDSYSDERAQRPALRAMIAKVELREHPEWEIGRWREQPVEVRFGDGRVVHASVSTPRGTRANPMTRDEIVAKFRDSAGRALATDRVEAAIGPVWDLDRASSVRDVIARLIS
jgi:2-methylcitrate dehydratase PrpD